MVASLHTRYALLPLFLVGSVLALAAPLFWLSTEVRPEQIARGHENNLLYQSYYPSLAYSFARMQQGDLPLWNPFQLSGTPQLANPASGIYEPLHFVFLLMPPERAMAVHAFLCLFAGGVFFALFLRSLGTRYMPALLGGLLYSFNGTAAAAMSRPDLVACLAWTPLFYWALREWSRTGRGPFDVLAALALAMMLLSGALALALPLALLAIVLALLQVLFRRGDVRRSRILLFLRLSSILLLATLVASAQWLPGVLWMRELHAPWEEALRFNVAGHEATHLRELLLRLIGTRPGTLTRLGVCSVLAIAVLPAALFHRHAKLEALYFLLAAAGLFPLALLLPQGTLPGLTGEVWYFPATIALVAATALGFDRLLEVGRDPRSPLVWIPILLVLAATGALFVAAGTDARGLLVFFVVILLPFFVLRLRWVSALCAAVLCVLVFVELTVASVNLYRHPFAEPPGWTTVHKRTLAAAREQARGGRVLISSHALSPTLLPNIAMVQGIQSAGGAFLPLTGAQQAWWQALQGPESSGLQSGMLDISPNARIPQLLNHMAVGAVVAAQDGGFWDGGFQQEEPRMRPVGGGEGLRIYVNANVMPRMYWTPGWRAVSGIDATLDTLADPAFKPAQECLVEPRGEAMEALARIVPDAGSTPAADWRSVPVTLEEEAPERLLISLEAPAPGVVVVADSFDPGWTAKVNGMETPIARVNGLFRGIPVSSGKQKIELLYRPMPVFIGIGLSVGTLGLLVLMGCWQIFRRR